MARRRMSPALTDGKLVFPRCAIARGFAKFPPPVVGHTIRRVDEERTNITLLIDVVNWEETWRE